MRGRLIGAAVSCVALAGSLVVTTVAAHPAPVVPPVVSPDAALSTSGDYASDVLGDPWDFSNDEDVPPIAGVGCNGNVFNNCSITRSPAGQLTVSGPLGGTVNLVHNYGLVLPWGRDGAARPVDAARYSVLTLSNCPAVATAIQFLNDAGETGLKLIYPTGCTGSPSYDLRSVPQWRGKIVRLEMFFGAGGSITLDWVRLHRPDASATPPPGVPVARTLTPDDRGGNDYATVTGNPWDMGAPNDVASLHDIVGVSYAGGQLNGTIRGNDSFAELPLPVAFQPDRWHRFSARLCFDGPMSLADAPGGGMVARVAWVGDDGRWIESGPIVVYPWCNDISVDLATDPAVAVNDQNTVLKHGWRGQHISRLRVDLSEDYGPRHFILRDVRFADDAAFSSSYPITYQDAAGAGGATADVYATTNRGAFDGVQIASRRPVNGAAVNTFTWNGSDVAGNPLANGTYWIYTVIRNAAGTATGYSSAPVRIERQVAPTPSTFVPLTPSRVLDTRDGTGGNIVALRPGVATELPLAGRGGVPAAGATAVVLNVTVDHPTSPGVITVWPSGDPMPLVSSLNFNPGDVVANLVTVKLGNDGRVDFFNVAGETPLIVDVVGYYAPSGGSRFTPLAPARVLDTGADRPIGPGATIDVAVTGVQGVPASGVTGVALNVTVDKPSASSYFTVYPTGEAQPNTSTLDFPPGRTMANLTLAKVGAGGRVSIYNYAGTARVVADVVGYFSAQGGRFVPVSPTRLVDTRYGTGAPRAPIGPGATATFAIVRGGSPVPAGATGAVLNVTATNSTLLSYLTVFPTGQARPTASTLNPRPGVPVPAHAYAKLGGTSIDVFNYAGTTDVVIDVFGYIAP